MKWVQLFDKLGKQKLTVTQHNDVTIKIDGQEYPLKLKFDKRVRPYFVIDEEKEYYTEFDERIPLYEAD